MNFTDFQAEFKHVINNLIALNEFQAFFSNDYRLIQSQPNQMNFSKKNVLGMSLAVARFSHD